MFQLFRFVKVLINTKQSKYQRVMRKLEFDCSTNKLKHFSGQNRRRWGCVVGFDLHSRVVAVADHPGDRDHLHDDPHVRHHRRLLRQKAGKASGKVRSPGHGQRKEIEQVS
jgi:hypothetical protein